MADRDIDVALEQLRAIARRADLGRDVLTLVYPGQPVPKARPRMSKHGVYTPTRTKDAEARLATAFRAARGRLQFADTVAIVTHFYVTDLRQSDTDNFVKLTMDAATKAGVWLDDSQVRAQGIYVDLDREAPRTVVAICPYVCTMSRAPLLTAAAERSL